MKAQYKRFRAGRVFELCKIRYAQLSTSMGYYCKSVYGQAYTNVYTGSSDKMIWTTDNPARQTAIASTDDISTFDPEKYVATGTTLTTAMTADFVNVADEYYIAYKFTVTGNGSETRINSVYLYSEVYVTSSTRTNFLIGAFYFDEPVTIPATGTKVINITVKPE